MTQTRPSQPHRQHREALILGTVLLLPSVLALIYVIVWMAPAKPGSDVARGSVSGTARVRQAFSLPDVAERKASRKALPRG